METRSARRQRRSAAIDSHEVAPAEALVPAGGIGESDGGGADRISDLPDDNLRHIISLLPTKESARTRILASRWRHLWCSAPLNLDCRDLATDNCAYAGVVAMILSFHWGPIRRFRLLDGLGELPGAMDPWLWSAAFDSLEELEFTGIRRLPPVSIFRVSPTLRAATIEKTFLTDTALHGLHFPLLKHLGLAHVVVSETSLHRQIAGCPALELLLIDMCWGFHCVRINSLSLVSVGARVNLASNWVSFGELVIENAPCLERLLLLDSDTRLDVTVVATPKLETLGFLHDKCSTLVLGSTIIQLTRSGPSNVWRHKHRNRIKCLDVRLKKIVMGSYHGTTTQVNFVTFFVLDARVLGSMTVEVVVDSKLDNEEFFAKQRLELQLENRASRGAWFHLTADNCVRRPWDVEHVRDLGLADPFACQ